MPDLFPTILDIVRAAQQRPKIVTHFIYPPIPIRSFDWSAVEDGYDGAEDSHCPIGYGATEAEAIADLQQQIEER
jgi:hypothetical protein